MVAFTAPPSSKKNYRNTSDHIPNQPLPARVSNQKTKSFKRIDLMTVQRIVSYLQEDMEMRKTHLSNACKMNYASCIKYLDWMEKAGIVTVGKHVRLTDFGRTSFSAIIDPTGPVETILSITPPPNVTVESTGSLTQVDIGMASVNGNCNSKHVIVNTAPDAFPVGITIVLWSCMTSNNVVIAFQTVTVTD